MFARDTFEGEFLVCAHPRLHRTTVVVSARLRKGLLIYGGALHQTGICRLEGPAL